MCTDRTSLTLPARLPIDAWLRIGRNLTATADSAAWWLGDWLVYGQDRYPERYRRAIDETALDYQTLRNYAWIARKFPPERRRTGLSMQHHAEVAALPPVFQDLWLDRAEQGGWSRNELRRRIRSAATSDTPPQALATELRLAVSHARRSVWEDAAERANCDLTEWMLRVLDAAARGRGLQHEPLRAAMAG
ncbi:LmbU family transcriptional regulator [Kitasatospora aureofaciens]|uniref:LmbU family transcriptional regulator n=1 Tax=Kitasatospora aureofaciens TaxID=1894 RepID=UPI001C47BE05|nr:LmbU family transcriptional regulator [Kitasatospora aureofaciens]MBV6697757.1 LmbU family transcriptional regulator [Kitasatospora aureofaciens]